MPPPHKSNANLNLTCVVAYFIKNTVKPTFKKTVAKINQLQIICLKVRTLR